MNRVVHFEIQATKPERAIKFYTEVFGWHIYKWEGMDSDYWAVETAPKESKEPGINGGLLVRPADVPPLECGTNAFVCTIDVENFDIISQKILQAGGKVAMPKFAMPGMAWLGYFLDTEDNTFGIYQEDKNAK